LKNARAVGAFSADLRLGLLRQRDSSRASLVNKSQGPPVETWLEAPAQYPHRYSRLINEGGHP
jgi:hypothetical protein